MFNTHQIIGGESKWEKKYSFGFVINSINYVANVMYSVKNWWADFTSDVSSIEIIQGKDSKIVYIAEKNKKEIKA